MNDEESDYEEKKAPFRKAAPSKSKPKANTERDSMKKTQLEILQQEIKGDVPQKQRDNFVKIN